jgi:hypothetical protein
LFEGAEDALAGGDFGDAEAIADLFEALVFEKAQDHDIAGGDGESGEGVVEDVGEILVGESIGVVDGGYKTGVWEGGGIVSGRHDGGPFQCGSVLVMPTTPDALEVILGREAGDAQEPSGEQRGGAELSGFFGEDDEDGLGDILGGVGVADLAGGRGVDEIDVAADDFAEGGLGVVVGVIAEELEVVAIGHERRRHCAE